MKEEVIKIIYCKRGLIEQKTVIYLIVIFKWAIKLRILGNLLTA